MPKDFERTLTWRSGFWIVMGVPPLCLVTIGGVAAHAGNVAYVVWFVSALLAFFQCFVYAEMAVMFSDKSGGASIHAAGAWFRYGKIFAPVAVWCNWVSWSPILSLGCSIAAAYIMNVWFSLLEEGSIASLEEWSLWTWRAPLIDVGFSLNVRFFVALILMSIILLVQLRSISGTVALQRLMGLFALLPLAIASLYPLLWGTVSYENYVPLLPLAEPYVSDLGSWNKSGFALVLGALFLAGWSTYGFEVVTYYTREFRAASKDTVKGLVVSGLVCMAVFVLLPLSFQGVLGVEAMLAPNITDGTGVAGAIGGMIGISKDFLWLFEMMMAISILLVVAMGIASSSRCLYQGSKDGWLPRYLGQVNVRSIPVRAMWTDYLFNVLLLMVACSDAVSFYGLLAVSNCTYFVLKFFNLNACWIYRLDLREKFREYKVGKGLLLFSIVASYMNVLIMGAGAKVWHPQALWFGLLVASLSVPMFCYRHYAEDKGSLSGDMRAFLQSGEKRGGVLPYIALLSGLLLAIFGHYWFRFDV